MDFFEQDLYERLSYFQKEKEKCEKELERCPAGTLCRYKRPSGYQYIHAIKPSEDENKRAIRRGINTKTELIGQLARKEYLQQLNNLISNNIEALTYAAERYTEIEVKTVIKSMNKAYDNLPVGMFCSDSEDIFLHTDEVFQARMKRHEKWANEPYERNSHKFNKYEQWTSRGLHVRSQREQMIAEMLYAHNIPFRYDQIIRKNDVVLSPDFTFLDEREHEFYLEYCGMMDNKDYAYNYISKRRKYESVGINEWTNMIYVFSSNQLMDTKLIKSIIINQIIPRL